MAPVNGNLDFERMSDESKLVYLCVTVSNMKIKCDEHSCMIEELFNRQRVTETAIEVLKSEARHASRAIEGEEKKIESASTEIMGLRIQTAGGRTLVRIIEWAVPVIVAALVALFTAREVVKK